MYAMVCTLLDIGQIVSLVSEFLSDPGRALGSSEVYFQILERYFQVVLVFRSLNFIAANKARK